MIKDNNNGLVLDGNVLLGSATNSIANVFATDASNFNHSIVFITPNGSQITSDPNVFELSAERMQEADSYLIRANNNLHRTWPTKIDEDNNNIRRDSYLVRWCQRVYSIGTFTHDNSLLKIAGNLAWPAQMYIDRFLYDQEPLNECEFYMFDLKSKNWFKWTTKWVKAAYVPKPSGIYAVLGDNVLNNSAKNAIDDLWKN